jgi:hypothetical protein
VYSVRRAVRRRATSPSSVRSPDGCVQPICALRRPSTSTTRLRVESFLRFSLDEGSLDGLILSYYLYSPTTPRPRLSRCAP